MTGFHEVRFPEAIARGASGGPGYSTTVITTSAGLERRNINWSAARGRWDVGSGLKRRADVAELIAFFRARRGRAYGFRFKDWTDYQALAQPIAQGDGTTGTVQLVKSYASGGAVETRVITRPVPGTVKISLDGVEAISGWNIDTATGLVTFTVPPASGVQVTADFAFDVPVRFDTDHMDLSLETYDRGVWPQIPIVEIRP